MIVCDCPELSANCGTLSSLSDKPKLPRVLIDSTDELAFAQAIRLPQRKDEKSAIIIANSQAFYMIASKTGRLKPDKIVDAGQFCCSAKGSLLRDLNSQTGTIGR